MASTPNFFLFSGLLFLARFTADVHSVKVLPDVLKGSTVVLRPVESVTSITTISWKHGDNLAAEWNGEELTFYNIFSGTCSLNTTTGELTINNVRPEHSGVYTPDINLRTRSAVELRVLSPVPKPSISHDCYPGETLTCTLRCMHTCTLDNVGHVEVYWILDDRREKNGTELPITKDSKEETFICSVKNSVSSENSTKLLNPLLPGETGVPVWIPVVITLAVVAVLALLVGWVYPLYRRYRIIKEIRDRELFEDIERCIVEIHDAKPGTVHDRILEELRAVEPVTEHKRTTDKLYPTEPLPDEDCALVDADEVILGILNNVKKLKLSEDSIVKLLTARYVILRILKEVPEVQNSREKVQDLMQMFNKGRNALQLYKDEEPTLQDVYQMILRISDKKNELKLSEGFHHNLLYVEKKISTIIVRKEEEIMDAAEWRRQNDEKLRRIGLAKRISDICPALLCRGWRSSNDLDQKLKDVYLRIWGILIEGHKLKLSEDDYYTLQEVEKMILTVLKRDVRGANKVFTAENRALMRVRQGILGILKKKKRLNLSEEEEKTILDVEKKISTILTKRMNEGSAAGGGVDQPKETTSLVTTRESNQTPTVSVTNETNPQTGASNDTRDPAADPLISSAGPEAEDKV